VAPISLSAWFSAEFLSDNFSAWGEKDRYGGGEKKRVKNKNKKGYGESGRDERTTWLGGYLFDCLVE